GRRTPRSLSQAAGAIRHTARVHQRVVLGRRRATGRDPFHAPGGTQPDTGSRCRRSAGAQAGRVREMSAVFNDGLSLIGVRRMMEGVIPPILCTASPDRVPNVSYLSLCEYVDPLHIALSYQFFNRSRENVLATRRASLTLDDPYTGAGVVMQLEYQRTETEGPVFERLRAK